MVLSFFLLLLFEFSVIYCWNSHALASGQTVRNLLKQINHLNSKIVRNIVPFCCTYWIEKVVLVVSVYKIGHKALIPPHSKINFSQTVFIRSFTFFIIPLNEWIISAIFFCHDSFTFATGFLLGPFRVQDPTVVCHV